ncbi:MAG: hypothetical protein H0V92_06990 [Pseudonocardiales bacterium]|nr:hypothetical protein [Pseudonocardiales bacterium]
MSVAPSRHLCACGKVADDLNNFVCRPVLVAGKHDGEALVDAWSFAESGTAYRFGEQD